MIILPQQSGLLIFRQPDHAELSAQAAASWRRPAAIPSSMWPRFIEAVRRHDDGWIEEERGPTLDPEGCPYDFKTLPPEIHVEVWRRGADLVRDVDPYLAVLVAQHNLWLHEMLKAEFTGLAEGVIEFPAEMAARIERGRALLRRGTVDERAAVEPEALEAARRLVSFFDGISLMLLGAIPVPSTTAPLPFDGKELALQIERRDTTLAFRPWPFEPPALNLEIAGIRLATCRFSSPEELAGAMARAPVEKLYRPLVPAEKP